VYMKTTLLSGYILSIINKSWLVYMKTTLLSGYILSIINKAWSVYENNTYGDYCPLSTKCG
jgi:hypothetical protein